MSSERWALSELLFALQLWAFGFIASRFALNHFGPFTLSALRLGLSFAVGWLVLRLMSPTEGARVRNAAWSGFSLGLAIVFVMLGLSGSSVASTSFITTLYVVFVPLIERWLGKPSRPPRLWIWLTTALVGTALMCRVGFSDFNRFDWFTLIGAVFSAVHIILIGHVAGAGVHAFAFNVHQSFWATLATLPFALILEHIPKNRGLPTSGAPWAWVAFLVLSVGLIAFWIQIRAQRVFSPTVVSLIFLLESPLASLYAYLIIGERLLPSQWLGGFLILAAAAGTILQTLPRRAPDPV